MNKMPDRIWATPYDSDMDGGTYCDAAERPTSPNWDAWCYVRADLARALTAERDRLAACVDAVMADRARIIGERDRLRLYAGHDDDCTVNRYPAASACSCGLRAASPAVQPDRTCPSCRDSLDLPSGDGCAIMTAHEPIDPRVRLEGEG